MSESRHTLVLIRHSKAEKVAAHDRDRTLTEKGVARAEKLAKRLAKRLDHTDLLLVSPALRTRETARPLRDKLEPAEVHVEETLYTAGPVGVLEQITILDESLETVVLVGHEPTISMLGWELSDNRADEEVRAIEFGVRPATAIILDVPVAWNELSSGRAHLRELLLP